MPERSKFKLALKQWQQSQHLYYLEKDQKSLARKIAYKIKKQKRSIVNFFYLHFLLTHKNKKSNSTVSTSNAISTQAYALGSHVNTGAVNNQKVLAVTIHAFYYDIFIRILEQTRSIRTPFTLYITTHKDIAEKVSSHIKALGIDAHIKTFDNRGRDILPFLHIIQLIQANGHQFVLKLHTKKSPQKFKAGSNWCDSMVDQLLAVVNDVMDAFNRYPTIGIISPSRHLYPLWRKAGLNMPKIVELADQMGYQGDIGHQYFVGGTMFYAKVSAFKPLLELGITDTDFEKEPIPLDGTLAHAYERIFGLAASIEGLDIIDTKFLRSLHD